MQTQSWIIQTLLYDVYGIICINNQPLQNHLGANVCVFPFSSHGGRKS